MKLTPAMRQFMQMKEEYPDAIILFRMGDFYECFYEDATKVSTILGITLTSRGKDEQKAPLAGIPYHALDKYLKKLVDSGEKIAICEQLEDPKQAKGVVKRGVVRVVTPGTVVEESVLSSNANNYLASIFIDGKSAGFSCCDISTGEFITGEFDSILELFQEISRFSPTEILIPQNLEHEAVTKYVSQKNILLNKVHSYYYFLPKALKILQEQFENDPTQLGLQNQELAICASGSLLQYLRDTQKIQLGYITQIQKYSNAQYMQIDQTTVQNLELVKSISNQKNSQTLLKIIDKTKTSLGSRLLKQWIVRPLLQKSQIQDRLNVVDLFMENQIQLEELQEFLNEISDIERLLSKITYGQANGRDVCTLKHSLSVLPKIYSLLEPFLDQSSLLAKISSFSNTEYLVALIDRALKDECPVSIREGNFIKTGFNADLDELWDLKNNSTTILSKIEKDEIQKTGIPNLKIKYNRVFGYFIEVTNRFKDKIPKEYVRKQSTVNSERFITDELKELETKIITAQDKIHQLEYELFQNLVKEILTYSIQLQQNAKNVAMLDCLSAFAKVSTDNSYTQPIIHEDFELQIRDARHPVVEQEVSQFIANDCHLDDKERMMILTGPNMAGKSTYMRQIALIIILAQIGCFVPAKSAKLSIVDKVFTRVGAYDDVSRGQSTFMVEMSETAHILQNATKNSFIIFDEIGSGTSTYDGVAIAWAVASDLAKRIRAKTLFATHYHVLTNLSQQDGVVNYNIAVLEKDEHITFLRKIIKGGTDKSYGLFVAKLAGIPNHVVDEAKKIQLKLEKEDILQKNIIVEKRIIDHTPKENTISYAKLKQKTLDEL